MAGEGAFQFGPLHQCTWKTGGLVVERGPVMTIGVEEEGPVIKGSSTKRKAEVAALPTEDQPLEGLLTKRESVEEPEAGCFKGEKPVVDVAAAGGEDEEEEADQEQNAN